MNERNIYLSNRSAGIMAMYWAVIVFLVFMMIGVPYFAREEMMQGEQYIFYMVFTGILLMFSWIMYRIYNMKYVVENNEITVHGAFNTNVIKIYEITDIKRTPIPFGFRLWGGSFIGGRYYIPGVGKAWVAMTNFKDGVLITTRDGEHYVITPDNPDEFIKQVSNN